MKVLQTYRLYPVLSAVISYHPGHSLHLLPLLLDIPHSLDEVILGFDLSLLITMEWKTESCGRKGKLNRKCNFEREQWKEKDYSD